MSGSTSQEEDIVGDRVLVGLQSVHISRLSTHPLPVAVGTLIAVAGQGPKDSNGAGKSSLIAQISLLHADEQWRFGSGAPAAVDLLFNAEDAGGRIAGATPTMGTSSASSLPEPPGPFNSFRPAP